MAMKDPTLPAARLAHHEVSVLAQLLDNPDQEKVSIDHRASNRSARALIEEWEA